MSKENNLHDYLADLYEAIADKKPNASKNPQDFRSEIEAIGTIGGINGVIEQYTVHAGATVTAGDFVEFVNAWNKGEIISTNPISMSACKLDNTRVLVAYINTSTDKYTRAYVVVVAIENDNIVAGQPVLLAYRSYEYYRYISADALTDSKAVVAVSSYAKGVKGYLGILNIEGRNISITDKNSELYYYNSIHVRALSSSTFLLAYRVDDGGTFSHTYSYLDYYCLTVHGGYSLLKSYNLAGTSYGNISVHALIKLSPSKVWCVQETECNAKIYGIENSVITVSSKYITLPTTFNSAAALSETSVLIARTDGYIQAIEVDGTNQTLGTALALDTYVKTTTTADADGNTTTTESVVPCPVSATSIVALNTNQALIAYHNTIDGKSYAVVATVDGTNITRGVPVSYTDYSDINQLIAFSDSSVVNIFANEFIAGVGMTIGDREGYTGDWYLDSDPRSELSTAGQTLTINFSSNGQEFAGIQTSSWTSGGHAKYGFSYIKASGGTLAVWDSTDKWGDSSLYRYITLYDEPSATAKKWLDKNGEKKSPVLTINQLTSTYVQPATSRLHNVGVARTAGTEGEKIDVYVVGEE